MHRSDDAFNITEQIVKDLYNADIVICDLSGPDANPNVMYELGIRLAFSNEPVILIREGHKDNRQIFDIGGFYTQPYDPLDYTSLTAHLKDKLKKLEDGTESYESPVLKIVAAEEPLLKRLSSAQATRLLQTMARSLDGVGRLFATAVYMHIKKYDFTIGLSSEGDINSFLGSLEENADALSEMSWSEFSFRFGGQPTVDHYLATRYLSGLIDPGVETKFADALVDYHTYWLSGDTLTRRWNSRSVYRFCGETNIIRLAPAVLVAILTEPDEEKHKNIFKQLLEGRKMA